MAKQSLSTKLLREKNISVVLDHWTSLQTKSFVGVVVFWINQEFEFNVKLLDFKEQSNHEAIFTKTMISYKRLWYIKVYWRSCRRCHKFYDIHY